MTKKHRRRPGLPPRSPALAGRTFLLSFDLDCGELLPGHRFIARGLEDDGPLDAPEWDESHTDATHVQGFSFEYELAPGVPPQAGRDFFRYLVSISYDADIELPWEPVDGGAIAPFEGGPSTHGTRGSWPLPDGARLLTFTLSGDATSDAPAGDVVVDLVTRSARWVPTA